MRKNIFREIRSTLGRFIAIFAISALGAGFYSGLKVTSPDMKATADRYYSDQHLMDFRLLSTMGFTDEDIAQLQARSDVAQVMAGYSSDFLVDSSDGSLVVRLSALPQDTSEENPAFLNRPVLVQGRLPENGRECLADSAASYQLGDEIVLSPENDADDLERMAETRFTVVGLADSPSYVAFQRGNTTIGSGRVDFFLYVTPAAFDSEFFTEVFLTAAGAQNLSSFSPLYEKLVDTGEAALESFGKQRAQARYDEIYEEGSTKLADARKELAEGRAEADEKLGEALQEIEDAEKEIADGWQEVQDNTQKLADAKQEIADGEKALEDGKNALRQGQAEYDAGLAEYNTQRAGYDTQAAALAQAQQAAGGMGGGLAAMQGLTAGGTAEPEAENIGAFAEAARGSIGAGQAVAQYLGALPDEGANALAGQMAGVCGAAAAQLDAASTDPVEGYLAVYHTLAALGQMQPMADAALAGVQAQLDAALPQLQEAEAQLGSAKRKLDSGWAEVAANEQTIADGKAEVADGEAKLAQAKIDLADAEQQLADGKAEYETEKAKAEKELADAEKEIADGQKELDELEMPEWFIQTRQDNPGYSGFVSDTSRIDAIAVVIPVFFFLVAALVCLTTMTRMVEEQRTQIGTMKALGYRRGAIAFKYVFYAGAASFSGALAGVVVGYVAFPTAIWQAYGMMYIMPPLDLWSDWSMAVGSVVASVLTTTLATLAACWNELRSVPATLMRPKAPRVGKRVLLERIAPLWRRMSFMQKVTSRNLFRYKKRFFMTVIGVAGCTALLVTGFGLRDSISGIVPRQYGDIYCYDIRAVLKNPSDAEEATILNEALPGLGKGLYAQEVRVDAESESASSADMTVYLFVAQQPEELGGFIDFHTRDGEAIPFPQGEGAVVTEKLATRLGLQLGDTVWVNRVGEGQVAFTVAGVMENYIFNTIYITPDAYVVAFGAQPEYDNLFLNVPQDADAQAVLEKLVADEGVAGAVEMAELTEQFSDMFASLDAVVWLVIAAAALLAFVVLYNLTNINITERTREIATLKVLGFYNNEVSSYVYRENIILTFIGTLAGLALGVLLHGFVIQTAEVDEVMFRRTVEPMSYLYSVVFTMLCGALVNLAMQRRLHRVDMVESLKSAE